MFVLNQPASRKPVCQGQEFYKLAFPLKHLLFFYPPLPAGSLKCGISSGTVLLGNKPFAKLFAHQGLVVYFSYKF